MEPPTTLAELCPPETAALLAASHTHDIPALTLLLKTTPAQSQHPRTLTTPLHAAVAPTPAAEETIRLLLTNGAIWNDLDAAGETPACIALRLGATGCYKLFVEAGVRAELLMARMGAWGVLDSGSESEDEEEAPELVEDGAEMQVDGTVVVKGEWEDVTAEQYLGSTLEYDAGKLLDADNNGVMMAWETTIMQASVEALLPVPWEGAPRSVLNIGFGMGIVDTAFQARLRAGERHVIVEAHPDVLAKMRSDGWMDKPGFEVLEGRWQDVLPALLLTGESFSAIYFDTFAEDYAALREFFTEYVIALLDSEGGRFGFFHGLGADRRVSWDVMTKVVVIDLEEAGLEVAWSDLEIEVGDEVWVGVKRRYWNVGGIYRLPVCTFLG